MQAAFTEKLEGLKVSLIGFLGASLLRLIHMTLRWEYVGVPEDPHWGEGVDRPFIFTFWHNRQLIGFSPFTSSRRKNCPYKFHILISEHRDGQIVAKVMKYFGLDTIHGSSSRGAKRSVIKLVKALRQGDSIGITPDGPKGPIYKLKKGVLTISRKTGAVILPMASAAERQWVFKSWDKMILPKPFSRAVFVLGELFSIPEKLTDEELEEWSQKTEDILNEVTEIADNYFEKKRQQV